MATGTPVKLVQYLPGAPAFPAPGDFVEPAYLPQLLSDFTSDAGTNAGGVLVDNSELALSAQVCWQENTLSYLSYVSLAQSLINAPPKVASSGPCLPSALISASTTAFSAGEGLLIASCVMVALMGPWM
jgi:hypothetical protein